MISPVQHPNASMAVITGFVASELMDIANQYHVTLTGPQSIAGATLLIGLVLFLGKKVKVSAVPSETPPAE